jgi:putative GTP pyrophosphokinase
MQNDQISKIVDEYDKKKGLFTSCNESASALIKSVLDINTINYHSINGRIKEREKLKEKIQRKEGKYETIDEITDIVGIRIITYFEDEVDKVAKIIRNEFEIDEKNSVDKRIVDNDKFGYKSLHYVVSFNQNRLQLTEYKPFENIKIEVQIRSILQHGWAEIEHDLGYKGEFEIPAIAKRTFYRLAALLEMADIEFVRLKELIHNYELSVTKSVIKKAKNIKIDRASLSAYIENSPIILSMRDEIVKIMNFSNGVKYHKDSDYSKLIERLINLNIDTIELLEQSLLANNEESLISYKDKYDGHRISALNLAAPIYRLITYLESTKNGC